MMNSKTTVNAIAQLKLAGWSYVGSFSRSASKYGNQLAYGLMFTKDDNKFFFNKDTYIDTMTPEENAIACLPIFN